MLLFVLYLLIIKEYFHRTHTKLNLCNEVVKEKGVSISSLKQLRQVKDDVAFTKYSRSSMLRFWRLLWYQYWHVSHWTEFCVQLPLQSPHGQTTNLYMYDTFLLHGIVKISRRISIWKT